MEKNLFYYIKENRFQYASSKEKINNTQLMIVKNFALMHL